MPIPKKIKSYLDEQGVKFEAAEHPLAYTAAEVAGKQHIPGRQMVKAVVVKSSDEFIMCVLPAIHLVDFAKLKNVLGQEDIQLAEEEELKKLFPEYEVGAEPPFGHLYGLRVFADKILQDVEEIVFNAGTHTDIIKISFSDYKNLANPVMADIGTHI